MPINMQAHASSPISFPLQDFAYGNQRLLLDPHTRRVYSSTDGRSYPQLVGRLDERGGLVRAQAGVRPAELWQRLDAYLKQNKVKLQEVGARVPVCRKLLGIYF